MSRFPLTSLRLAALVGVIATASCMPDDGPTPPSEPADLRAGPQNPALVAAGRDIFRFDTFGDETFWSDTLELHEVIRGTIGDGISPVEALGVGLKVDLDALPQTIRDGIVDGTISLTDPATTVALLSLDAVVGVMGEVEGGVLTRVGITCALCHSTVDNAFDDGIGRRLDGWPNRDLAVGAIIALSPYIQARPELLTVYQSWDPGMYDPRFNQDGLNHPVVLPPAFGLRHVKKEIYTGDDDVSYWNAYVAITQMHGHGTFVDSRIGVSESNPPDMVTPKLPALRAYQLSLETPDPLPGEFDPAAAQRGHAVFNGVAKCAGCHRSEFYTDINAGILHEPDEVGQDPAYALRSVTKLYRTTPLRGLWHPPQLTGPYFHDGSAQTLEDVVNHYVTVLGLSLTAQQRSDLVEYLKSL